MIQIKLYIQTKNVDDSIIFKAVNFFKDEEIFINLSVQNIVDISKTYTDYTQTFTIPADNVNNPILKHWYNQFIDNGFDCRIRANAFITVDTKLFRSGLVQLEKASIVDGKPQSYSLTFYGKLVNLKDKLKEDNLNQLTPLNESNYQFSPNIWKDTISSDNDYNLQYPLVSSKKIWNYGLGLGLDISTNTGAIVWNETFPALRVKTIFDAIATKYGITFESAFFNTKRFTELFMHLKNREVFSVITLEQYIEFSSIFGSPDPNNFFNIMVDGSTTFNGTLVGGSYVGNRARLDVSIKQAKGNYSVQVFFEPFAGSPTLFQTISGIGNNSFQTVTIFNIINTNSTAFEGTYTFTIVTKEIYEIKVSASSRHSTTAGFLEAYSATPVAGFLNVLAYMPDMKVSDFIAGILKMFNLVIYSFDENVYNIEPLDDFYNAGNEYDITKFCADKLDISRIKAYKKIVFKYTNSENYSNELFYQNNNLQWGELQQKFDYDGGEYKIELPFENLVFNKLSGNVQVGFYLKTDLITKTVPKQPVLFYKYGNVSTPTDGIKLKNNLAEIITINNYNVFGQDVVDTSVNYSMNFGFENSTLLNEAIENGLYKTYYINYLINIFNIKSRMIKIRAKLNPSLILNIRLNDRIIIRKQAYFINTLNINLMTHIVDFELITDKRT